MARSSHQSVDDLVAYARGELDYPRQAEVEAHLRTCPECQQHLWLMKALRRSLDTRYPLVDNPAARAEIMRQVRTIAADRARSSVAPQQPRWWSLEPEQAARTWRPALLLAIVVVVFGVLLAPRESWADFPLARYVGFADNGDIERLDSDSSELGAVSDMHPFELVSPPTILGDFRLSASRSVTANRAELNYERTDGLVIRVTETLALARDTTIERPEYEHLRVQGVDILLSWQPGLESVSHFIWVRNGIVFSALVDGTTLSKRIDRPAAKQVVEEFISAQDKSLQPSIWSWH